MQPKFCNKCGNPLTPGDMKCSRCGAPVKIRGARSDSGAKNTTGIPSFEEVASRLNNPVLKTQQPDNEYSNPEGTVLLAGPVPGNQSLNMSRKASITLSFEDMLRGCTKVVDFGTGDRYELVIPAGLTPGDRLIVKDTGIKDPDTGDECEFDLTVIMR